jgi:predicted nuclease of restriction endonuclease-like (RecB) superfamily
MGKQKEHTIIIENIKNIISNARNIAIKTINFAMVEAYWNIGRLIVEEEQNGNEKAEYGEYLIKNLSIKLRNEFGNGYNETNLKYFRQFYLTFPISHTLSDQTINSKDTLNQNFQSQSAKSPSIRTELTWSHYRILIRVKNDKARVYYMNECAEQNWSTRALERQINSFYYDRILASKDKSVVSKEAQIISEKLQSNPKDFIKDPYVLEFLDIQNNSNYLEKDLEQGLIDKLQHFLLELGRGFSFVARQKRISTETKNFYIDLVFYNYILKCFILIDLKTDSLTPQDIGQMDLYIRIYEDKMKSIDDNPTIGLILCTDKDETIVKYSILEESKHIFASRYQLYLPTENEIAEELNREKSFFLRENNL